MEEPKDLGVKIVSKEQEFWERVKKNCEEQILENEQSTIILKSNLELAEGKIQEEKDAL